MTKRTILNALLLVVGLISMTSVNVCYGQEHFYPKMIDGQFHIVDKHGNVKMSPVKGVMLTGVTYGNKFINVVDSTTKLHGLMDFDGKYVIPAVWDVIVGVSDNMYHVITGSTVEKETEAFFWLRDGKAGLLDSLGRVVVPLIYSCVGPFQNYTAIYTKGQFGQIKNKSLNSKNGRPTYPYKGKWGLLGLDGREITPQIYDYISHTPNFKFTENGQDCYIVRLKNRYGAINEKGEIVVPITIKGWETIINYAKVKRGL